MLKASIPEFPNYDIYIDGRVVNRKTGRELKLQPDCNQGYYRVRLSNCGKQKTKKLHRLLAECFMVYNCDFKETTIDHIDKNNQNNSLVNLRLSSCRQQCENRSVFRTNKLGQKNIHFIAKNSIRPYKFEITRHGIKDKQHFETLEEAIRYRDQYYDD